MDGLPSALTEAMAFGVAVVVSDLPGQLEVVQNGRNGIVVPQNDVTALSQTLLDLSASAEKRRHLGRKPGSASGKCWTKRPRKHG